MRAEAATAAGDTRRRQRCARRRRGDWKKGNWVFPAPPSPPFYPASPICHPIPYPFVLRREQGEAAAQKAAVKGVMAAPRLADEDVAADRLLIGDAANMGSPRTAAGANILDDAAAHPSDVDTAMLVRLRVRGIRGGGGLGMGVFGGQYG